MSNLTVIGGGKMGEALVGGLIDAEWTPAGHISVVEPVAERREELAKRYEGLVVLADLENVEPAAEVLLAVKPDLCEVVCRSIASNAPARVLSIAAGVTSQSLGSWLGPGTRVVRAMPNTPALVGAGMAAIAAGTSATTDDLSWASQILASVGEVIVVEETAMDAVTGVSGSGPAYVYLFTEALIEAAVAVGLDKGTADTLARQTVLGAARLLTESGTPPNELRANVTSPGGTTAEGIAVLEHGELRALLRDAVEAATSRSRELGAG
ncbi:MAG: pyrroline-5-carboxylate reductase [Acidimicrobiales bacterium]